MGNSLGAARDNNFFDREVKNQRKPAASSLSYAAVFNSHTYPNSAPTAHLLESRCGVARDEQHSWVGLALKSALDGQLHRKTRLALAVVADCSGSMQNGFRDPTTEEELLAMRSKLDACKQFVKRLHATLLPNDLLSVSYYAEHSGTALAPALVADIAAVDAAVDAIACGGGTKLILGLQEAAQCCMQMKQIVANQRQQRQQQLPEQGQDDLDDVEYRVVFLTDMCDTTEDADGPKMLFDLSKKLADEERIHVSYLGVGVDFDGKTADSVSRVPGCNFFCIMDEPDFEARVLSNLNSAFVPIVHSLDVIVSTRVHDVTEVFGAESNGVLERDVSWTPSTHYLYPEDVRATIRSLLLVCKRLQCKLPLDVIGHIVSFIAPTTRFRSHHESVFPSRSSDDGGYLFFPLKLKDSCKSEANPFVQVELRYVDNQGRRHLQRQKLTVNHTDPAPVDFDSPGLDMAFALKKFCDECKCILPLEEGSAFRRHVDPKLIEFMQKKAVVYPELKREIQILEDLNRGVVPGGGCQVM